MESTSLSHKRRVLKLKKQEETPAAQPSLPPGLEGAAAPPATPAAPAPEAAKEEPKQEAVPSLKKKEEVKTSEPIPAVQVESGDDGPGLVGGISAILTFAGAACALVFFVLVLFGFLL